MFRLDADKRIHFCDGVTRRDFLHAGSLAFLGLSMPQFLRLKAMGAVKSGKDVNCIQLMLVGGPLSRSTIQPICHPSIARANTPELLPSRNCPGPSGRAKLPFVRN